MTFRSSTLGDELIRGIVGIVDRRFKRGAHGGRGLPLVIALLMAMMVTLAGCGGTSPGNEHERPGTDARASRATASAFYATRFERTPDAATLTALGRALFFDPALSASGRMACSTCHDPAHAWGPPNGRAVQRGGVDMKTPGVRAVPSLRYRQDSPAFDEHYVDDDGDDSFDQGPAGGLDWDGRAASAHDQARAPLLSPFEMANRDSTAAVERLRTSASAKQFRAVFGEHALDATPLAWTGLLMAIETFQQSPADFYPYSSRYDDYLRGTATLSAAERRGLAVFNDPARGNCAVCHPSELRRGAFPQFTDHGFAALGVPRNPAIPANADRSYHDLGLCGPLRTDLSAHAEYCGMFKAPSLRNVATRRVFFHNGAITSLTDAVRFYQYRDTRPGLFYPRRADGTIEKFDDLPAAFRATITFETPFDSAGRATPRFSDADAAAVVAFLRALTDRP